MRITKTNKRKPLRRYIETFIGKNRKFESITEFASSSGLSRSGIFKFLTRCAWDKESEFFDKISNAVEDNRDRMLWIAGYNPLTETGLTYMELVCMWEFMVSISEKIRGGHFHGTDADFQSVFLERLIHCSHLRSKRLVNGCRLCSEVHKHEDIP